MVKSDPKLALVCHMKICSKVEVMSSFSNFPLKCIHDFPELLTNLVKIFEKVDLNVEKSVAIQVLKMTLARFFRGLRLCPSFGD